MEKYIEGRLKMFESILSSSLTITSCLVCFIVSIVLGFIIAIVHNINKNSNKNFLVTLILLPLIVNVIIMMVNGNLGTSVAILGAFSLIRFRSAPGSSKELLSIFLAMAVGLSTGMGQIYFAIMFTFIACGLIILLEKTNILSGYNSKILKIVVPEDLDYEGIFDDVFNKYTDKSELLKSKTINMGSLYELEYRIVTKNGIKEKNLIDDIRIKNGNLKVMLSNQLKENEL